MLNRTTQKLERKCTSCSIIQEVDVPRPYDSTRLWFCPRCEAKNEFYKYVEPVNTWEKGKRARTFLGVKKYFEAWEEEEERLDAEDPDSL